MGAYKVESWRTLFDAVLANDSFGECVEVCYQEERDEKRLNMLRS